MNIVVNAIPLLYSRTGIGNYILSLCRRLIALDRADRFTFFYGYSSGRLRELDDAKAGRQIMSTIAIGLLRRQQRRAGSPGRFLKRSLRACQQALARRGQYDLYFEPNHIPLPIRARHVMTTVHDLSAWRFPQWHPRERADYFRLHFRKLLGRSDLVVTPSAFTRDEVVARLGLDPARVMTIHNGYESETFRPADLQCAREYAHSRGWPEGFILVVGSIEPRKNLDRLLQAHRRLPSPMREQHKLVLVGFGGWRNREIMQQIERMGKSVHLAGYLRDNELAMAYRAAAVFAYPSLYEGFGLPPVEAMACGCAVLASSAGALPEVCGDAARYVDPTSVESIADGLRDLLDNPGRREELAERGLRRCRLYDWGSAAEQLIGAFQQLNGA